MQTKDKQETVKRTSKRLSPTSSMSEETECDRELLCGVSKSRLIHETRLRCRRRGANRQWLQAMRPGAALDQSRETSGH